MLRMTKSNVEIWRGFRPKFENMIWGCGAVEIWAESVHWARRTVQKRIGMILVSFSNSYFQILGSVMLFGRGTERFKLDESTWNFFCCKDLVSNHWKLNQQVDCDSLNASKKGFRFFCNPWSEGGIHLYGARELLERKITIVFVVQ